MTALLSMENFQRILHTHSVDLERPKEEAVLPHVQAQKGIGWIFEMSDRQVMLHDAENHEFFPSR